MYAANIGANSNNYSIGGASSNNSSPAAMAFSSAPGSTTQFSSGYTASGAANNNGYSSYQFNPGTGGGQQQWPFYMSSMPQMGRSGEGQKGKGAWENEKPRQVFVPDYPIVPGYTGHIPGFKNYSAARTFGDATRDTSLIIRSRSKQGSQHSLPGRIYEQ